MLKNRKVKIGIVQSRCSNRVQIKSITDSFRLDRTGSGRTDWLILPGWGRYGSVVHGVVSLVKQDWFSQASEDLWHLDWDYFGNHFGKADLRGQGPGLDKEVKGELVQLLNDLGERENKNEGKGEIENETKQKELKQQKLYISIYIYRYSLIVTKTTSNTL